MKVAQAAFAVACLSLVRHTRVFGQSLNSSISPEQAASRL